MNAYNAFKKINLIIIILATLAGFIGCQRPVEKAAVSPTPSAVMETGTGNPEPVPSLTPTDRSFRVLFGTYSVNIDRGGWIQLERDHFFTNQGEGLIGDMDWKNDGKIAAYTVLSHPGLYPAGMDSAIYQMDTGNRGKETLAMEKDCRINSLK